MNNKESILNKINKLINKYNNISIDEKIKLLHVKAVDTNNLYICLYDFDKVGLFRKVNYKGNLFCQYNYNYIDVYCGVDTDNVAIYVSRTLSPIEKWYKKKEKIQIYGEEYNATCKIDSAINICAFKLMMYHDGIIDDSNCNIILSSEILGIIDYANRYYKIEEKQSKKQKILEIKREIKEIGVKGN